MLKNKFKMIVVLFTIIALISAFCITAKATDSTPVVTSENTDTTNEVSTISDEPISNEETNQNEETEILYKDLYIFDNSVTMDKIVDGNVYIFGNNVKITGKVNGNLFVFGNEVTFTTPYETDDTAHEEENYCYVSGSIFAFANKLSFNGIAQDIYAFAQDFTMSYKSYIMRDVKIASSNLTLKGYITRDAYLYADNFNFGTPGETEENDDSALITGDLYYSSSKEAQIPDSVVKGEIKFTETNSSNENKNNNLSIMDYVMNLISVLIYTLVIYLLLNWLSPKFFENSGSVLKKSALSTFGIGILIFLVAPIVALILLCLTLFPLSLTLATVYALLLAISFTVVAGSLTFLLKDKLGFANKKALLLVIVAIVLWALKQIPVIGSIITIIISIFGLGLITKNIINKNKKLELNEEN